MVDENECMIMNHYTTEFLLSCVVDQSFYTDYNVIQEQKGNKYQIKVYTNGVQHVCKTSCYMYNYVSLSPYVKSIFSNDIYSGQTIQFMGYFRVSD